MTTLQFVKIRQWYLPFDADTYLALNSFGIPLVRIHEDFLPTVKLVLKPRNIKAKLLDFNEIRDSYFEKIGEVWLKDKRVCRITSNTMSFETTHSSASKAAKLALPKIEASLRRFFTRWGYNATFEYSENNRNGRLKLHVSYRYDSSKLPLIPLDKDVASSPKVELRLGFVKISITPDVIISIGGRKKNASGQQVGDTQEYGNLGIEINISIASGTDWKSIHTSRCLYSQVSNVLPMLRGLMDIPNQDYMNHENPL